MNAPLLLYDGDCNLCNATVRFVLDHERAADFRFAPLQSGPARNLLAPFHVDPADLSSVLVLEDGRLHRESDAAIRILSRLRAPWRWLAVMQVLPRPLRDRAYRFIGKRRYAWFGRTRADACALPGSGPEPGGSESDSSRRFLGSEGAAADPGDDSRPASRFDQPPGH